MYRSLWLVGLLAGCEARIGSGAGELPVDAAPGTGPDAATAGVDAPPDAPRCAARTVFLQFEGVTLTKAAASDATQDRASWIGVTNGATTATVPPYLAGSTDRAARIQEITDGVRAGLASFPIIVVTQRPAAGPYVMVVFGGLRDQLGTPYTFGVNEHDCGDAVESDVGWIGDLAPRANAADYAIGAIGWGLGLNGTADPGDCMCGWANSCQPSTTPCTLSPSIATTTNLACPNLAVQDEVARFEQAFCQ